MSIFKRLELLEPPSAFFYREISTKTPLFSPFSELENELGFALDLLNPNPIDLPLQCIFPPPPPSPFEVLSIDLIQIKRLHDRTDTDSYILNLCDRVSALELGFDRVLIPNKNGRNRKYSLQAEIKGAEKDGIDRKYKWTTEIKGGKKEGCGKERVEKNYKWTTEIKGKGKNVPISHTYTLKASTAPAAGGKPEKAKKEAKGKGSGTTRVAEKGSGNTHVVEIEDTDSAAIAVKQVFARKRAAAVRTIKGKKKELSPQDAAMIIQVSFRAHLVRRSQTLRGLRDLAVAKAKLKELRALFTNFSYRRLIACDAEERQRFSEKIIVLLLNVDAIEGPDYMVRATRRSMVEELEAMLDVVDPQPPVKLGSLKRRKFDLPVSSPVQKEMTLGVAEVVKMLEEEDEALKACGC